MGSSIPKPYPPHADPATRRLEHFREKTLQRRPNEVMFGVFLPTSSWGLWATTAETETEWTYQYNKRIVRLAEDAGLHYAFPAARWKGIQGDRIDWRGASLDTITLAAGLLEATTRIAVLATIHTNVFNPVVAAKLCADMDQIGSGRFGLNIVSGWNEEEFQSMNIPLLDHKERYNYTREWLTIVKSLWATGTCTFEGRFFKIDGAIARPLPVQRPGPVLANAGQSYTGIRFAAEEADYNFARGAHAAKFRDIASQCGSSAGFIGTRKIILGKTDAQAHALADEIMAKVDLGAVRGMRITSGAATEETVGAWMAEPANIREAVLESALTGSPETVAREMAAWLLETRVDGVCLSFFNYFSDLEVFARQVLPRLADHLKGTGISISAPPEERVTPDEPVML